MHNKIEMLDIVIMNHTEYLPRSKVLEAADQKQSPKVSKNTGKRAQQKQAPQPSLTLPESMVTANGVPTAVMSFLEVCVPLTPMMDLSNLWIIGGRDDLANANAVPILPAEPATCASRRIAEPRQHAANAESQPRIHASAHEPCHAAGSEPSRPQHEWA